MPYALKFHNLHLQFRTSLPMTEQEVVTLLAELVAAGRAEIDQERLNDLFGRELNGLQMNFTATGDEEAK